MCVAGRQPFQPLLSSQGDLKTGPVLDAGVGPPVPGNSIVRFQADEGIMVEPVIWTGSGPKKVSLSGPASCAPHHGADRTLRSRAKAHFLSDLLQKVAAVKGAALEKAAGYLEGATNIPSCWDP